MNKKIETDLGGNSYNYDVTDKEIVLNYLSGYVMIESIKDIEANLDYFLWTPFYDIYVKYLLK